MVQNQESNLPVKSGSGAMFDRIAERYDLLNKLISFGLDRRWRKKLLRGLGALSDGDEVLDVATGTADVALDIVAYATGVRAVGLDPSTGMLRVGREKIKQAGKDEVIELIEGDAQAMPFDDARFAAACMSFGIRNVPDRKQGLQEMVRTTRPGGRVVVLELSEPRKGLLAPFARFHIHHVVPWLGSLLSGDSEYRYLAQSIRDFPPAEQFADIMRDAGLVDITVDPMTFGVAHLYIGTVPTTDV